MIIPSPAARRVWWTDFRDYVGVYDGPVGDADEGKPWNLPDLYFDRNQYITEVERASRDRSWESHRIRTARLLYERLKPLGLIQPPDLSLAWVSPAWNADGVTVMFERVILEPQFQVRQQTLHLTSMFNDPDQAADDMIRQLLSTVPGDWASNFGTD